MNATTIDMIEQASMQGKCLLVRKASILGSASDEYCFAGENVVKKTLTLL